MLYGQGAYHGSVMRTEADGFVRIGSAECLLYVLQTLITMPTIKFDGHDRRLVIAQVEAEFGVKLERIGRRQKYLRDSGGRRYCIFGGYGTWHGLPEEVVETEEKDPRDSVLVIAKRLDRTIDVFAGPLQPLVAGKYRLAYTKDGQYEFNVDISGNRMKVRELPLVVLWRLGTSEADHTDSKPLPQTQAERERTKLKTAFEKLSSEDRAALVELLESPGV